MRPLSTASTLALAILVGTVIFVAVAITMPDIGLTWDEPAYMGTAQSYGQWFTVLGRSLARLRPADAFSPSTLQQYWSQEQADLHPPLGKVLPAITWRLFRAAVGDFTALRLGNALIFSALAGLVCLFSMQTRGLAAGVFASASLALMPRLFFHAHLTTLDIPVAFAWLLTVYLFWRWASSPTPRLWLSIPLLGLAYGLALGTKNTSFILPGVLLAWIFLFRRTRQALALLIGMGIVALFVFFVTWPWLYLDLPGHVQEYIQRMTIGHWDIPQYYLGETTLRPAWHYPFVMIGSVVPSTVLIMSLLGTLRVILSGREDSLGWLIIANAILPLLFFAFVSTQAYGGERLFIVVFPFLAMLAGIGFSWIWGGRRHIVGRLRAWSATQPMMTRLDESPTSRSRSRRIVGGVLAVLVLLPGLMSTITMHPYQLSYFNEIIGGLQGAQRLGLELTYWCETYKATLPFLNNLSEQAPSVWTEEDGVLYTYQKAGLLRADIKVGGRVVQAGPLAANYALIQNRPSGFTPEIQTILREGEPQFIVTHQGVPLAYVFKVK